MNLICFIYDKILMVIKMKLKQFTLGDIRSNCYVITHQNKALVIDPGYPSETLINYLIESKVEVEAIYLTHGHFDHIGGVKMLKDKYNLIVYAPLKDKIWFTNPLYNRLGYEIDIDVWVENETILHILNTTFEVIETPGHSEGSTCLYGQGVLFSGDTLFFQSIGRTDIPFSSAETIYQSIKKLYAHFSDDTICYPGHGRPTTIGHEKKHNPFVRG
jgi:hydroxyacylglutathione hydrolase